MRFKVGDKVKWKDGSIHTLTRMVAGGVCATVWELGGAINALESELEKLSDAPPPGTPTLEDTLKLSVETLVERM